MYRDHSLAYPCTILSKLSRDKFSENLLRRPAKCNKHFTCACKRGGQQVRPVRPAILRLLLAAKATATVTAAAAAGGPDVWGALALRFRRPRPSVCPSVLPPNGPHSSSFFPSLSPIPRQRVVYPSTHAMVKLMVHTPSILYQQ